MSKIKVWSTTFWRQEKIDTKNVFVHFFVFNVFFDFLIYNFFIIWSKKLSLLGSCLVISMLGLRGCCGGGLEGKAHDWCPSDPGSIPLGEKKENKRV